MSFSTSCKKTQEYFEKIHIPGIYTIQSLLAALPFTPNCTGFFGANEFLIICSPPKDSQTIIRAQIFINGADGEDGEYNHYNINLKAIRFVSHLYKQYSWLEKARKYKVYFSSYPCMLLWLNLCADFWCAVFFQVSLPWTVILSDLMPGENTIELVLTGNEGSIHRSRLTFTVSGKSIRWQHILHFICVSCFQLLYLRLLQIVPESFLKPKMSMSSLAQLQLALNKLLKHSIPSMELIKELVCIAAVYKHDTILKPQKHFVWTFIDTYYFPHIIFPSLTQCKISHTYIW